MAVAAGASAARAWLTLLRAPALGGARIRSLLDRFGNAEAVLDAGPAGWRSAGLAEATRHALRHPDPATLQADLDWLGAEHHHLLTCERDGLPPLLARMPGAPAALFVVGRSDALWQPQVAVVGSRNASRGGAELARDFAGALAASGLTVTSGLAEGIDAAAHAAALAAAATTIAVMGTGPDRIYPARHRDLAQAMVERGGALVSEFPPGTGPKREHFPRRNRIIAGLALGVLVIEAGLQSGALITARLAGEAGREVFALPGSIHNPLARGCHRLIRDGAALVESADEVLAALAPAALALGAELRRQLDAGGSTPTTPTALADPDYQRLWQALGHDPVGLDALVERTGLTVEALSSMLLLLELEGAVACRNGRFTTRRA